MLLVAHEAHEKVHVVNVGAGQIWFALISWENLF
jgi:hypothetical protein